MCRRPAAPLLVLLVLVATGCGGSSKSDAGGDSRSPAASPAVVAARTTETRTTPPPQPAIPRIQFLPVGVPQRATGPARAASARVVRRWSAALRAGHVARAADYFAQPSRVQNGSPVVTLHSQFERLAFNASFPCGAIPTRFGGARNGYTIVTFRLTERIGGDCHGAAGHPARCAIRVRRGRITDWFRLPTVVARTPKGLAPPKTLTKPQPAAPSTAGQRSHEPII